MTRLEAIADPVRLAIARFLGRGPASAAEVADGVGVHLNTARSHLRALVDSGVVQRRNERRGTRGRPIVRYGIRPDWLPAGDELLGLAQLAAAALDRSAQARDRGRRWGRAAASGGGPTRHELERMLERLGFEARAGEKELTLSGCPCPLVAPDRPGTICALVDDAIDGALAQRDLKVGARHHDAAARRCRIALASA